MILFNHKSKITEVEATVILKRNPGTGLQTESNHFQRSFLSKQKSTGKKIKICL